MSGRLVSAVFESALPAWLKPYAAAFATFAADDGSRVYPSIGRIARMLSRSERQTQRATTELRRRAILALETSSGRGHATRYRFNERALTFAADGAQLPLLLAFPSIPQAKRAKPFSKKKISTGCTGINRTPMSGVG